MLGFLTRLEWKILSYQVIIECPVSSMMVWRPSMRGEIDIMHELRKARSTVDHASTSDQVVSSYLHHIHRLLYLAMASNSSLTLTLADLIP